MNNPSRMLQLFCILLLIGLAAGCGNNDEADPVAPPVVQPPSAGTIGVYGNPEGTHKQVIDRDGVMTVYVVHNVEDGTTGSSFRIQAPAGWTMTEAASLFPVNLGNVNTGIMLAYGSCRSGAIHLMTLTYELPATPVTSGTFRVLPHEEWPNAIQVVDCDFNLLETGRGIESRIDVVPVSDSTGSPDTRRRPATQE